MYIIYVDEAGDFGLEKTQTQYLALSGLVIHELRWNQYLDRLVAFRKKMKNDFGLKLREEIHGARYITRSKEFSRIKKHNRLAIIRQFTNEVANLEDINIINVLVDKKDKKPPYDVFEKSWDALLQRFENTIKYHNFPGPQNAEEKGIIISDNTINEKLKRLIRKKRRYNPVPFRKDSGLGSRDLKMEYIIEDPNFRDSRDSYFIQAADLAAFLLYQYHTPNIYMKNSGARKYFERLDPVLCKYASSGNNFGIVYL